MNTTITAIIILLACGLAAGFFMHRSDFCIAGMFRDIFLFRNTDKIKPLVVFIALNMLLFHTMHFTGILKDLPFPWYPKPSWLILAGGFIFGIGMVLAGSCVVGVLYKIGSGQFLAVVVLAGIFIGNAVFFFTLPKEIPAVNAYDILDSVTIPQSMNINPLLMVIPLFIICLILIFRWIKKDSIFAKHHPDGYIQPLITGSVLAVISSVSYYVVNATISITASYAKFVSYIISLISPKTYNAMPIFSFQSEEYYNYFTGSKISGSLGFITDGISLTQYPVVFGVVAGSAISALMLGEFHPRFKLPVKQYASSLIGGVLLGYSARIALGCNIWHLAGGLPVLAWGGFLFLIGIFAGAWIGSLIIKRFVI